MQYTTDVLRFRRAFGRKRPDVVVVNSSVTPAPLLAAHLLGIPVVTIVRESLRTNPTLNSLLPKSFITACIDAWSSRVVTVSRYVADQYGHPSTTINPPVELGRVPPPAHREASASLRLLMLGTIGGDKNQTEAVEAVAIARRAGADVQLDIYGHGSNEAKSRVSAEIKHHGLVDLVRLHHPSSQVRSLMASSDALLMCSRNEAFGRVTVEALQSGLPVIGYDAGGTSEILAGETPGGILVEPSPEAMARAIYKLAERPDVLAQITKRAYEAGRPWCDQRADQQLLDLLEDVTAAAGPPARSQ
jgi:glycosyltransferase involved in cell wall biosynthesis